MDWLHYVLIFLCFIFFVSGFKAHTENKFLKQEFGDIVLGFKKSIFFYEDLILKKNKEIQGLTRYIEQDKKTH